MAKKKLTTKVAKPKAKPRTNKKDEEIKSLKELVTMASDLTRRTTYASQMGLSFDGERDMYAALGYTRDITWQQYEARYKRESLGKRIINAFPNATWRGIPILKGNKALQAKWVKLQKKLRVVHYFTRVDRLAGIGCYAALLLGFKDGKTLDQPVEFTRNMELSFLSPFSQINAQVASLVTDTAEPRYGQPLLYDVKLSKTVNTSGKEYTLAPGETQKVHWSRVLHVAEGLQEDEIYGTPRLEAVYNRLQDVQKIAGGSGEMFWLGAFPGLAFMKEEGAEIKDPSALTQMQNEIEDYIHHLSRYLRLQGMKIQELKPQVANPNRHLMSQLQLISGGTGIPLRILIGSERGELASSEDRKSWHERVHERQLDFGELVVVRPFIDRLMMFGALTKVEYEVDWPPLDKLTDKEAADIAHTKAQTVKEYLTSGGDAVLPVFIFLTDIMGYDETMVEEIMAVLDAALDEEDEETAAAESEEEEE